MNAWQKSFGSIHVMSVTAVKYRLKKLVKDYHNQAHHKVRKKKAVEDPSQKESMRRLNKQWRENNNSLFYIGKDMDRVVSSKKLFYEDLKMVREGRLSGEIDEEYEEEQRFYMNLKLKRREKLMQKKLIRCCLLSSQVIIKMEIMMMITT